MGDASTEATRVITREDVRRYAVAVGADDPVHHDVAAARAAGWPDLLAPTTFFCSLGLSLGRVIPRAQLGAEGLPLADDLAGRRVVAGGTEVEVVGDICAGDEITVAQRSVATEHKQGSAGPLELHVYERTYRRGAELVVTERFTRIAR